MQPNILVIIPHDLGTHLSCYGEDWLNTPTLDGLADEGVRFWAALLYGSFLQSESGCDFYRKISACKWSDGAGKFGMGFARGKYAFVANVA